MVFPAACVSVTRVRKQILRQLREFFLHERDNFCYIRNWVVRYSPLFLPERGLDV